MEQPSTHQLLDNLRAHLSTLESTQSTLYTAIREDGYATTQLRLSGMVVELQNAEVWRKIHDTIAQLEQAWETSQDRMIEVLKELKQELKSVKSELDTKEGEMQELKEVLGECRGELKWIMEESRVLRGELEGSERERAGMERELWVARGDLEKRNEVLREVEEQARKMKRHRE